MSKSVAASLTAAVRRGYDAARRCDGYGGHGCCDHDGRTTLALEELYNRAAAVQRQLLLPLPSIILAGSPPVSDCAAGPLRCGSWGRRIPG